MAPVPMALLPSTMGLSHTEGHVLTGKMVLFIYRIHSRALASLAQCPLPGLGVAGRRHSTFLMGTSLMPAIVPCPCLLPAACMTPSLSGEVPQCPASSVSVLLPLGSSAQPDLGGSKQETLHSGVWCLQWLCMEGSYWWRSGLRTGLAPSSKDLQAPQSQNL